jgi:hypothetical protein
MAPAFKSKKPSAVPPSEKVTPEKDQRVAATKEGTCVIRKTEKRNSRDNLDFNGRSILASGGIELSVMTINISYFSE